MNEPLNIQYLPNKEIDKKKWDECIANAENGLIYSYSFYLDAMCDHWDALVLNDYETVMPLTWNKKYGIRYLYQPFLTAQLGIFGKHITEELVIHFLQKARDSFRYIDILLNSRNTPGLPGSSILRKNYVLDLNHSYGHLYGNYSENLQRNIKKAAQLGCTTVTNFDAEKVISLAVQQMRTQGNAAGENVDRFRKLYHSLYLKQMSTTYGIVSAQNNELLASCIFFFSHSRAYYILVGNHPESKNTGASHALIDTFIKDHAGTNLLLDFEGSDIPGLATFYSSFGAKLEAYPALKINDLPFYLKWLKK